MENPPKQEGLDYTTPTEIADELHTKVMNLSGKSIKEIKAGNIARHFDELSELNDMSALLAITSDNTNKVIQSCGNLMKVINTHLSSLQHESMSYALVFAAYKVGKVSAEDMHKAYEKVNVKFQRARGHHLVTLMLSQGFHVQLTACYRTLIELGKRIEIDP